VQELAGYWAKSYEMQRVADRLNRYEQYMTTIDGVDIHFLHVRSPVEGATPCVMTHGWPGSVMVAVSERWARTRYTDLRYYGTPKRGGHFAAYEAPGEFVAEVRAGLRALV
jgi:hypothetical protein